MLINLYWGLFIAGVAVTVLSTLFSGIFDALDFDIDIGDLHLPVRPFTFVIFFTVFGGVGIIASYFVGTFLALIPAIGAGVILSKSLEHLLCVVLKRYETNTASSNDFIGKRAVVLDAIKPDALGRISFTVDGNTISGLAKEHRQGVGFPANATVRIMAVENQVYYVARYNPTDDLPKDEGVDMSDRIN